MKKMKISYVAFIILMDLLWVAGFCSADTYHEGGGRYWGDASFNVGDKVHLVGQYTVSSEGTGEAYTGLYDTYIIEKIEYNAPNPYALRPIDKEWIDGWASQADLLHDYTDDIFRSYLRELQIDSAFIYFGDNSEAINALYSYYILFNHAGKYDVKRAECWNSMFPVPFPGVGEEFWFSGYVMTPEILGNYLYGLAGCYWGFSGKVIHQGAGYAQKGTTAYLDKPELFYGDNEDDYHWIEAAIIDSNVNPHISPDLSDLAQTSFLWDAAINLLK